DDTERRVARAIGLDDARRDAPRMVGGDAHLPAPADGLAQSPRDVSVRGRELVVELVVAAREGRVAFGDQNTLVRVADAFDIDAQTETIEQLRPQLALLGIHGPDEDEARGVAERNAFALDDVDAHRGCVE